MLKHNALRGNSAWDCGQILTQPHLGLSVAKISGRLLLNKMAFAPYRPAAGNNGSRMKKWMKCLSFGAIAVVLAACGPKGGSDFVGSWQSKDYADRQVVVEKNGENFLLKDTSPAMWPRGKIETIVMPAVYKDGMLEVSAGGMTVRIGYVKDTDVMLMPTAGGTTIEYRRVK